jgi:twinkle protein
MVKEPENKPCPSCRASGGDVSGDHMYHVKHPVTLRHLPYYKCRKCGAVEKTDGSSFEVPELMRILPGSLPKSTVETYPFIKDRGINMATRKDYGVRTSVNGIGDLERHFYPITKGSTVLSYKFRDIADKGFGRIAKGVSGDTDLFGMLSMKGTPRYVLITEGEEDAMAAHQMLSTVSHNLVCLSLQDGSGNMKGIENNLAWLQKAEKVYFCPDGDDAGAKAVEKVAKLLPEVRLVQDLTEKDANDMLLKGKSKDFINSFLRAKKYSPSFLVQVADVIDDVVKLPEYGRLWPWPSMNAKTFGMRDGEGMYVGAGVKIGKSEFINELVTHRIQQADGDIPAVIKFEEMPAMTVKKIAGKMDKTFYHRPDMPFLLSDLKATAISLEGKMYLYKAFGIATWDIVANYIRYVVANGTKTIIIDPITKLTNHLSSSETETELRRISNDLACMAQDLGFFYVVTGHLKAPMGGKTPHERGGRVESNQFRGSRAMMENCYYLLGIERNKDPDLTEAERNVSTFVLLEDRSFGNVGKFNVTYDKRTGDYLEPLGLSTVMGKAKE